MVTTALAETLSCSGNVCFRIVRSCWRMTYRVTFWEKYIQQRWFVKCNALYTEFLIRMSMILPQQCRYHMQAAMPYLLRIWWHHEVHHMWFPIHSMKCCTKQEGKFVRISFHLWMTIPHHAQHHYQWQGMAFPVRRANQWWVNWVTYHSTLVQQELVKHNTAVLPHLPYSPKQCFSTFFFFHIPLSQYQTCMCITRYCKY